MWQYTPYTLPFALLAVVCGLMAAVGWRRRAAPGAVPLMWVMLGVAVFSAGYAVEWAHADLPGKLQATVLQYVGIGLIPGAWLVCIAQYFGRDRWLTRGRLLLLAIEPVVTVLAIVTNDAHHLYYLEVRPAFVGPYAAVALDHGPLFFLHTAYAYTLLAASNVWLLRTLWRSAGVYRGQAAALIIGALSPWLANVAYVFGLSPWPRQLDLTPFGFVGTGLAIGWAIRQAHFLDLVPVAREAIFEHMADPMIALDQDDRVVYLNAAARRAMGTALQGAATQGRPYGRGECGGIAAAQAQLRRRPYGRGGCRGGPGWPPTSGLDPIGATGAEIMAGRGLAELLAQFRGVTEAHAESFVGEGAARRTFDVRISPLHDRQGRPTGRLLALRDITAHQAAAAALSDSEARYRRIVETAHEGIWMLDPQATTVFVNERLAALLGHAPIDMIGRPMIDFVPEDERAGLARALGLGLNGASIQRGDVRFVHRDGREVWAIVSGSGLFDADGRFAGVLALLTDITERKRLEHELAERRARLERLVAVRATELLTAYEQLQSEAAEREDAEQRLLAALEEKEVLLKEVHHRVKNNLQVISSLLVLQAKDLRDPAALQMFAESRHRVHAMAQVHERLYRSEDLAHVDLAAYVQGLAAYLARAYAPAHIRLSVDAPPGPRVGIDAAVPLGLILNELVTNALRHAFPAPCGRPHSGASVVTTENPTGTIVVTQRVDADGRLALTVRDNGVGFPPGDPFSAPTTLGLQLVHTLARQIGATVELVREGGTEVRVTLQVVA